MVKNKKIRFIQVNCKEENNIDPRQAEAVLKYKPDLIFLEYPQVDNTPITIYNKYQTEYKPLNLVEKQIENLEIQSEYSPWIKSDVLMWRNIVKLWKMNINTLIYLIDAPMELTRIDKNNKQQKIKNWLWWIRIYLREKYMARNIQSILKDSSQGKLTALVFLQSFHWRHVKFLLTHPSNEEIWNYYFNKFTEINQSNISIKLRQENNIYYKYWEKISDFK